MRTQDKPSLRIGEEMIYLESLKRRERTQNIDGECSSNLRKESFLCNKVGKQRNGKKEKKLRFIGGKCSFKKNIFINRKAGLESERCGGIERIFHRSVHHPNGQRPG